MICKDRKAQCKKEQIIDGTAQSKWQKTKMGRNYGEKEEQQ